jgi:formate dehydrogenase accessory protein FdhE
MTFLSSGKVNYPARIARAELLATRFPFAEEILLLYLRIAKFQQQMLEPIRLASKRHRIDTHSPIPGQQVDLPALLPSFAEFLSLMQIKTPAPLRECALHLSKESDSARIGALENFWLSSFRESLPQAEEEPPAGSPQTLDNFFFRAFLQPYAEFLSGSMLPLSLNMTVCRCPRCDSLPVTGVLRPEGDGGKRFLLCAWCSQEWEFRRLLCASCGEDREEKLPIYVAEQFPHIRVESCDTCNHYIRTIDLTKDGNAVALVDDLAAIPLTLWAHERGFSRIQSNLLGT